VGAIAEACRIGDRADSAAGKPGIAQHPVGAGETLIEQDCENVRPSLSNSICT
jgi:hypothetical protein